MDENTDMNEGQEMGAPEAAPAEGTPEAAPATEEGGSEEATA